MTTEASSRLGSLGLYVWQSGRNAALGAAEYLTPVLSQSQFAEKGVLTPEEFVAAGDMLVLRCPTWQWQAGDPKSARPFLPPDKQFLLTRNVPCQKRAAVLGMGCDDEADVDAGDGEDWVATHTAHSGKAATDDDAPDMVEDAAKTIAGMQLGGAASSSDATLEEAALEGMVAEEDDPSALGAEAGDNILRTRTYDVSISYDKCAALACRTAARGPPCVWVGTDRTRRWRRGEGRRAPRSQVLPVRPRLAVRLL